MAGALSKRIGRAATVAMGGNASLAMPLIDGRRLRQTGIRRALRLAREIGAAVIAARGRHADVVQAVFSVVPDGQVLFEGKVTDVLRRTTAGFTRGSMRLAGGGRNLEIEFQNEYLIAREDGPVRVTVPDLICLVAQDTGDPVTTEVLRYGLRVVVLALPAPLELKAPLSLSVEFRLNYPTAADAPAVLGRSEYLADHPNLGAAERAAVVADLQQWRTRLHGYIDHNQAAHEYMEVTASVNSSGAVKLSSVRTYLEQGQTNQLVPVQTVIAEIPSPEFVRQQAYQSEVHPTISPMLAGYNGGAAANYIDMYTSRTSNPCQSRSTTKQDASYYNPSFQWYVCNDCANYVSQALYTGGIQPDATWSPGTYDWINASGLYTYMTSNGYWTRTSYPNAVPGDVINYTTIQHVDMIDYSDGTTVYFSGHTNDRLHDSIGSDYQGVEYFHVAIPGIG